MKDKIKKNLAEAFNAQIETYNNENDADISKLEFDEKGDINNQSLQNTMNDLNEKGEFPDPMFASRPNSDVPETKKGNLYKGIAILNVAETKIDRAENYRAENPALVFIDSFVKVNL